MTLSQLSVVADQIITATRHQLPTTLREQANAVPVIFQSIPLDDVIEGGFDSDILGLFTGPSHGTELDQDQPMPPQIILYLENIWDYSDRNLSNYRREVRQTYLHELGHYFGWDEDDLTARGLD